MLLLFVFIIIMVALGVVGFFFKDKIKSLSGNKKDDSINPAPPVDPYDTLSDSIGNKISGL
jgi:hypothetical protein